MRAPAVFAPLLACLALACAVDPVPQDRYYRLGSEPDVAASPLAPALDATVVVERFAADGLTRDRAIVYSRNGADLEVRRHFYHHWTEPPAELLRDALVVYLRRAGVARRVVTPELRVPAEYEITGRVQRFERVLDGERVHVRLQLVLRRLDPDRVVWSGVYDEEGRADGSGVLASVAAFSRAVERIWARFAADVTHARSA